MHLLSTYNPMAHAIGNRIFVCLFCWMVSLTTLLGSPTPVGFSRLNNKLKSHAGANQPPVVVATSTTLTGTSPLSVTFTGNKSYDPDGDPIIYSWDFGDGTTSTQANPVHVFTQTRGKQGVVVQGYTARLTVADNKGGSSISNSFVVSIPNTAPKASITNPVNNAKYPLDKANTYTATATVTDERPDDLTYTWTAKLRRNNRDLLVRTTGGSTPAFDILPIGCDGEDSYYVISLKVTDLGGLSSAVDSVRIYPDCNSPKLTITGLTATTLSSSSIRLNWTNPAISFDDVLVVGKAGSGFATIPTNATYTTSSSFTATGTDFFGGKALYQGTSTSLVVTNLTAGQLYYFRVYTRKGTAPWTGPVWTGGVEINSTPPAVVANRPPVVVSSATSLTGTSPLSVTFTGDKSYDPDGDQLFYEWRFSDNTYLNVANPVRVFSTQTGPHGSGTINEFTAQLTVTDSKGQRTIGQLFNISLRSANQPPVAVATSTALTGTSPLSVTFTGNKSYDPDNDPITYEWDFGDDSNYSSEANPVHVFTAKPGKNGIGLTLNYTVRLTVIDSKGVRSATQTFYVTLQNNAPTVRITNPANNAKYPLDKATSYTLAATASGNILSSPLWQVKLRHNNREQLITTASGNNPVVTISPAGCDGDDYYYLITVKVTDPNNQVAQDSVKIYPDCSSPKLNVTGLTATTLTSSSLRLNWTNPSLPFDKVLVVGRVGSGLTNIPLEPNYTANASFTGNGSELPGGGKVLFQGTGNSVTVTELTAGQTYYFRVYARAGNGWSGGVQVNATPVNPAPSSVSTIDPSKCYRLVSRVSGKVLGVEGSSQDDGAAVRQRTDNNQLSQRWRFTSVGGGYYEIGAVHSNKAIDVLYGSQDDGMSIQQWTFNGNWSYNQHFSLQQNASGYYQITARHSGKALDVQNSNTNEGGLVVQYTPNGGVSQQWSIEERSCTTTPPSSTTTAPSTPSTSAASIDPAKCYRIQSRSSGLTLNVPAGSSSDGTTLRQNTNTDQLWQKWRFTPADGQYYNVSALHNLKGIQVSNSAKTDNALLEQWTYWGGWHQQWIVQGNADGFYTFTNRNSSKAMTVRDASTAENTEIIQLTLGSGQNQQWTIVETTCPAGARAVFTEPAASFRLQPNPARDYVLVDLHRVEGQPVALKINDLMGRAVHQLHVEVAPAEPYRLDTSQLPTGLYFVQITPDGQTPTALRLLLQR